MATDESLLDVIVEVRIKETGESVNEYVERIKQVFGGLGSAGPGDELAKSIKKSLDKTVVEAKEAAGRIVAGLREALLRFGLDKDALSIRVRLLGDDDIQRRLQDLQSQVSAAQKEFQLAEPGEIGNADRAAAVEKINSLRQTELVTLQAITDEMITQRGLDSVADKATAAFLTANQQAQNFAQQLKEVNQLIAKSGSSGLREEFAALVNEAQKFQLTLRQAQASGDLIGADNAVASLNTLGQKFDAFRDRAQKSIVIRTNAKEIAEDFDKAFRAFQRQDAFDAGTTRGSHTAEQKVALLALKKEVGDIRDEFIRLAGAVDLTADQIARMGVLAANMDKATVAIGGIRKTAQATSLSVNSLGNNAYQMGQAFEDAAVGFSLNGIAGAVRGASNNITFLIQNISQAKIAQLELNKQLVPPLLSSLPLYAAIGAAVSLLVVGPLSDWISSLNDIEFKTRGLAETLKREFADVKFQVSMEMDARSAVKAVKEAKDLQDAIAVVIKQANDSEDMKIKIITELDILSQKKVFQDLDKMLQELQEAADARVIQTKFEAVNVQFGGEFGPDVVLPPTAIQEAAIQQAENYAAAIDTIRIAWLQAQAQGAKGIVPRGELEAANSALALMVDEMDELVKSGVASKEQIEEWKKGLQEARQATKEITELTIRQEKAQENLLKNALDQLGAFKGLSAEYQFLDAVNDGRLLKEDKILHIMEQERIALEKQAEKLREQFGNDNPKVNAGIADARRNLSEEQRIDLTTEILAIEKEIASQREDADKDAERAAERRKDIQEKIAEEEIKGLARVAKADDALQKEQEKQALDAQQKLIQQRIEALQKKDKQSQRSAVGDIGQQIFGDDVQPEIERLQQELKTLRDDEAKIAAVERIKELDERIFSEREESRRRIEDLRKDLQEARQEEIDALNKTAEEIQKLIDQLKLFERQNHQNLFEGPQGIPEIEDGERTRGGGPMFLPEDAIAGIGNAQANANAAAMDGVDFKSSSLETLTDQTNKLLLALNEGVSRLDMQTRLA